MNIDTMEIKKYILMTFCLFASVAQSQTNERIVYEFTDSLTKVLIKELNNEIIIHLHDSLDYKDFCFEVGVIDNRNFITCQLSSGIVGAIAKKSNRYIKLNNTYIPVYFESDLYFSSESKPKIEEKDGEVHLTLTESKGYLFMVLFDIAQREIITKRY